MVLCSPAQNIKTDQHAGQVFLRSCTVKHTGWLFVMLAWGAQCCLAVGTVKIAEIDNQVVISNGAAEISFDLASGRYSGKDLVTGTFAFVEAQFRMDAGKRPWREPKMAYHFEQEDVTDSLGQGKRLRIYHEAEKGYDPVRILIVTLYDKTPYVVLGFGVKNQFSYDVRVAEAQVLYTGELFKDQQVQDARVLRGGAGAEPTFVEQDWQIQADNSAMLTYKDKGQRRTLVAGGLKYKEFMRKVDLLDGTQKYNFDGSFKLVRKGHRQMTLTILDSQGKRIKPGQTWVAADTFYLDFVTVDPFENLEAFGLAMRQANNAQPNIYDFPTLCGWMVSTGSHGEGKPINHSLGLVGQMDIAKKSGILKYTPVAVRLEPDYYCYSNYGDTQQGWWDDEHFAKYNSLREPYETFSKFCHAVKTRGGIPFTYFQGSMPSNDFAAAHPEWMLNNDISRLHVDHTHQIPLIRYDYTDPGFQAHVLKRWGSLREAGLQGVKMDYPETAWAFNGGFEDKSYTTVSAYRKMFELCREGLGPDAFIHERIIGNPTHETVPRTDTTAGVVDLQRVWNDSSYFAPEMATRMGLRWYKNRVVFSYYPDGKSMYKQRSKVPLPVAQRRTLLTIIGLLSGRLELGTSFGSMSPEMLHDISRLYPMISEAKSPRPVDMLLGKKHPEVYVYDVTPQWAQVILFNSHEKEMTIEVPFSGEQSDTGSLGLKGDQQYYVYDFWNQKLVGKFRGNETLAMPLKGNEALVYSVHECAQYPQFISTNRHVMQGMMELHDVAWNNESRVFSGRVDVVAGETMEIVVATNGFSNVSVAVDHGKAHTVAIDKDLLVLKIDCKNNQPVQWQLKF